MGRKMILHKKSGFPAVRLALCGFLLGILIPNLIWKLEWHQKTAASVYLLGTFSDRKILGFPYFIKVLRMRGSYFCLAALCGISVFGVPLAVLGMVMSGMITGMLLTLSILQFGLAGGAFGLGLLMPQYLLYIPAVIVLLSQVYKLSMEIWKNHGLLPHRLYRYGVRVFFAGMVYLGGILLEVYCNPWITEMLTKSLKIFS